MENFNQEVKEVLSQLTDVLVKGHEEERVAALNNAPTEKLINDMQSILDELKSRVVVPVTKALHELPVGAKVRDVDSKYCGSSIVWLVADHNFYDESQTTLLSERILTFKPFDAAEPNNSDEWRSDYGNNDYSVSNIHQWLNSDEGDWFKPLHEHDQAPTEDYVSSRPYVSESGFLTNLSSALMDNILFTNLGDIKAQVFLLSSAEVGLSNGSKLAFFKKDYIFRKAKPTKECVEIDHEGDENEPDWWWLRTPHAGNSYYARIVNSSGTLSNSSAYYGHFGVRPALNLSSEVRVKAEPDENGIYDIVFI